MTVTLCFVFNKSNPCQSGGKHIQQKPDPSLNLALHLCLSEEPDGSKYASNIAMCNLVEMRVSG